uniref:Nipped-B protein n=1 Tax=Gouania willdenowi TaxID=441366 RepID=A0A8C5EAP6_GOUWI
MNGDMPHVPITTLAGIASLTDLLNQLPLPSPLPATTAKSLLFNGRISEEVSSLLVCRDENLVTQLAHGLNQVSTEHIELKDNLGNDEPEGEMPLLLQTLLSRNPKIFRDKSKKLYSLQQPIIQPYKISQNQVHGSPASNYQQSSVPQSPTGCFSSPQSGSSARFVPQQNSPIPSPYTPQSPGDYMQYNPPSYSQSQHTQQVADDLRNENKTSGQLSRNSSNHHETLDSGEDYLTVAHRLRNQENNSSHKAAVFSVNSPQYACSPTAKEGMGKTGLRPPLIMQSPPPDVAQGLTPERASIDRKRKQRDRSKEEEVQGDKNALYDIISSPSKDSARLTLKLSRVKAQDIDQSDEQSPTPHVDSELEAIEMMNDNHHLSRTIQEVPRNSVVEEQVNSKLAAVLPNPKDTALMSRAVFEDADIDALAEMERTEQEAASDRERLSKEVQDKDKPLKKRKQDSYPQEPGAEATEVFNDQGGNSVSKLTARKTCSASNGASRPALMVSIDLQQAGRVIGQPVVVLEEQPLCVDHLRRLKSEADEKINNAVEKRPGIIRQGPGQHAEAPQNSGSDNSQPVTSKRKQESQRESKHRLNEKTDGNKKQSDHRQTEMQRQKPNKHCDSVQKEEKNHNSHRTHTNRPGMRKTESKTECNSSHGEDKVRNRDTEKEREKEKSRDREKHKERAKVKDRVSIKEKDKDKELNKDTEKEKEREKDKGKDREHTKDTEKEKDREHNKDTEKDKDREKDKGKDRDTEKDKDREKDKDKGKSRDTEKDKDKGKSREKDKEKDKIRDKDRDKEKNKDKERETDKARERKDRERVKSKDKVRDRDKDKDRDMDNKRDRVKDKLRDTDKDLSKEVDKDRERDRTKKHKTPSRENCNKTPDNSRTNQGGSKQSADLSDQQRTNSTSLQSPVKKEQKPANGNATQTPTKRNPCETKPTEFPSYLLGGKSGSLKNFVIPKLKRDGKDPPLQSKDVGSWIEPCVRLERVSLVENLNKKAKPVVVLERLSADEVKMMVLESRSKHSSRSKTWTSFNKSARGGIIFFNIRYTFYFLLHFFPHLIFVQNEFLFVVSAARKRSKKNNDKTWKHEEKRRSGDPRRAAGFHNARRGSGGRYRDLGSEDSEDGSPPPSLSEEKIDSSTFKRFAASLDNILENLEDVDLNNTDDDDDEIPQELLFGKQQLSELSADSAKIKAMGIFNKFSSSKLVKLLNILEKNIQDSVKLSTLVNHDNESVDEERLWRDLILERVTKSADACLTALHIMTCPHMPKAVYLEDVIERVLQYTKFHMQNSLYPQYDPVYRGGGHTSKSKRGKVSAHKQKVVVTLYNKVCDVISNISELLEIQLLTDTTILQVSTLGITPFFVENVSELQLCAITLVTAVFSRYEKHRQLILEEIFTSLARLPTSKRSLRNFRLNSDSDGEPVYIQMVTALVLQLIQCVVQLPTNKETEDEPKKKVDNDVVITNSYETAMRTAQNFLSVFLKKCGSKQGEEDYRPLFENFVHDLLSTVNRPEWPASELLLSLLGRLLVSSLFSNKQTEMALRVASLDYLGTVASRLRKDAVTEKTDQKAINRILREHEGNDEIQQLQRALLNFLDENIETDPALVFTRKFYIAQWFRDTTSEAEKAMKSQNDDEDMSHSKDPDTTGEIMQRAEARKKFLRKVIKSQHSHFSSLKTDTVDYEDSCLIVRYLASMRPFAQSFDIYLSQILRVLGESAIAVRTKAMKCLSEVVAVDPSILARLDMQRGVHCRLMDNSTSVREAAVELLGRFVLSRPELIEQYYDMLIERILDTGISVRKRVIKILRDICLEQPDFHKITEMCVRMIRRVNDEEGIKKLVNETFQKIWFSPTPNHDKDAMTRKILNITDVVLACKDTGYDWFEQLLQNLFKSEENASYKPAKKACVQLVDNLVEHIIKSEESLADCEDKGVTSGRLVACITTLYLFSKIRAQLLVKHAMTMQPYLTTKCNSQNDFMVICNVAKILELVVPLMELPSETFLTTIEEDLMKLIIKYGMTVVQHCVSCLGAIVNKVTHNYKFVWACFNRYYGALAKLKTQHQEDPTSSTLVTNKPTLLRSLFTVGALCRHFDFDQEEFKGTNKIVIKDKVLELLLYFTTHEEEEVQIKAIIGLGFQFIMHPELMFVQEVKVLYNNILSDEKSLVSLKIQVLKNLQTYLQEEDSRMQEADREWKKQAKQEDLKEMGDISSGMSSSIMQIYLKQVLESFLSSQSTVRHFALNVITLTLNQGLIHPVQCVPYLVAMGTDPESTMKNKADQQLVEIDKKYSGFIHMKAVAGLKMSYQVQQAINGPKETVIRGYRHDDSDSALCSHLYTMVRGNRQHRRAFLLSLLSLFDDSSKIEVNMLLFVADNLAYFPYQSQEEPLFIMHHIDITLSVSGSNLLQSFKESDEQSSSQSSSSSSSSEEEESEEDVSRRQKKSNESDSDDDEETMMERLPENTVPLLDFSRTSQGILLLLMLKQHLKNLYGFSDSKIQKYSPTEAAKVYDKAVNRKSKVHFNPGRTLDYLKSDFTNSDLSYETKRHIVKQYLDFKLLMEHLDRDEEDEDGEANANARNKAITSLLKGPKPKNHNHSDHMAPRKSRKGDSAEDSAQTNESLEEMDIIAICCSKYKDRPQIAQIIRKIKGGYSVHWMTGSYSGPWVVAKKRDGRKKVPWVDSIRESDIIFRKISLTSGQKLSPKVAQTLRKLYAAKEGNKS